MYCNSKISNGIYNCLLTLQHMMNQTTCRMVSRHSTGYRMRSHYSIVCQITLQRSEMSHSTAQCLATLHHAMSFKSLYSISNLIIHSTAVSSYSTAYTMHLVTLQHTVCTYSTAVCQITLQHTQCMQSPHNKHNTACQLRISMNTVLCAQQDDRIMAGRIHKILNNTQMMKGSITTVDVYQTYTQGAPTSHALCRV